MDLSLLSDKITSLADQKFEKVLRSGLLPGNLIAKVRISKGEFRVEVEKLLESHMRLVPKLANREIQPSKALLSEVAPETTLTSATLPETPENEPNDCPTSPQDTPTFNEGRFNELHAQKAYMTYHPNNAEYKALKALKI